MAIADDAGNTLPNSYVSFSREGEVLANKYRLIKKVGEGGMGAIYEAEHTFVGRHFAIKFLYPEFARDKEVLARFEREAKTAGALQNENIVAINDFGFADDGTPYIVMEHLVGEDLRKLLVRDGQLSVQRAVNLVIQACRGLHAAHAKGIIHRDLKPENLFITRRGDGGDLIKILDFGIAKLRGDTGSLTFTRPGTVMGTWHYMPMEQIRGDKELDNRADIYSLAAILYESLTGAFAHPGETYEAIVYHSLYKAVAPLCTLRPGLPKGLEPVVHKSLALEPSERHQSVAEFARDLTAFADRQVTPLQSQIIPSAEKKLANAVRVQSEVRAIAGTPDSSGAQAEGKLSAGSHSFGARGRGPINSTTRLIIAGIVATSIAALAGWFVWWLESRGSLPASYGPSVLKPAPETRPASSAPTGGPVEAKSAPLLQAVHDHPKQVPIAPNQRGVKHPDQPADKADKQRNMITGINKPERPTGHRSGQIGHNTEPIKQTSETPPQPPAATNPPDNPEPVVIERSRGTRKVVFDKNSPYQ